MHNVSVTCLSKRKPMHPLLAVHVLAEVSSNLAQDPSMYDLCILKSVINLTSRYNRKA